MSARNPASHLAFARCSPRKAAGALRRESLHRKVVHGGHPALNKDTARTQHYFCARGHPALKKDTARTCTALRARARARLWGQRIRDKMLEANAAGLGSALPLIAAVAPGRAVRSRGG